MTVVVLVIGVITSLMIASQSQSLLTTRSENTLENVLAMAHRQMSNGVPVDRLEVQGDVRFTVISADGKAMLDSDHPIEEMDTNLLYRPEVQEASKGRVGHSQRYSTTLVERCCSRLDSRTRPMEIQSS